MHRAAVALRAALLLAVELGHHRVHVRALGDRVAVRAVRRGDHVVRLERRAARRRRPPPGRSRRAGSPAARPRGSAPPPSPRSGGSAASRGRARAGARPRAAASRPPALSSTFAIGPHYADPRMGLVEQWRRSGRSCPADWGEASSNVSRAASAERRRAAALLGPASARPASATTCASPSPRGRRDRPRPGRQAVPQARRGADPRHGLARRRSPSARSAQEAPARAARRAPGTRRSTALPADWSDLLCRARAHLERPPRPRRAPDRAAQPDPRAGPQRLSASASHGGSATARRRR